MENQSPNSSRFQISDIQIRFWPRFTSFISSILDRKDTIKSFCYKNNIEYPPKRGKKYHLATSYVVESNTIKEWFKIRDKIILVHHGRYVECQKELEKSIVGLQNEYEKENEHLARIKQRLTELKTKLKSTKDSLSRISLENNIATTEASIKNQQDIIDSIKSRLESEVKTIVDNTEAWRQQVEIINGTIDLQINKYISRATKRIRRKLNYNEFKHIIIPYSKPVEKIVEGQYNEK